MNDAGFAVPLPPGIVAAAGDLLAEGQSLTALARQLGTPLYVYRRRLVTERIASLRAALAGIGCRYRMTYALKANRHPGILAAVRQEGDVGIDCCSPREIAYALSQGFAAGEVSATAGMLSDRDLAAIAGHGVHLNLDSFSAIRRYAAVAPGVRIGLRINPGVIAGYGSDPKLVYGNTKFGFDAAAVPEAMRAAAAAGLVVDTLHMHCGWNLQRESIPAFRIALGVLAELAKAAPEISIINVGGGLGVRQKPGDAPLEPPEWAELIREVLAPLGRTIACEPGTYLVADSGLLLVEVNTVERRRERTWVGIDAGHNVNVYPAHYGIPLQMALVGRPGAHPSQIYTVVGNINEANDVFARDVLMPELREGDLLALFPVGAYGSAMASDHCLRGGAAETVI